MKTFKPGRTQALSFPQHGFRTAQIAFLFGQLSWMAAVHAAPIETGNPDLKLRWDNTIKYSDAFRLKDPYPSLIADPEFDDGDRNFKKGMISNRVDLFSEFDVVYKGFGARVSGAAWYDSVYNRGNDNNSAATINHTSSAYNEFSTGTRDLYGRRAEVLDAFVFGKGDIGDLKATFRLGKHTLQWGESLFFGFNGIAAAQSPVDVAKAVAVPSAQFKEFIRPVNQVSGQLQITSDVSVGAYYQFKWEPDRLPGVGSYFSFVDIVGPGAENFAKPPAGPGFVREEDQSAKNGGQGGLQLKWNYDEVDYGFYAVKFHSRSPTLYLQPAAGQYQLVYAEGIKAYGVSASKTIGAFAIGGEASVRRNMPLISSPQAILPFLPNAGANNNGNPAYAVGNSAHVNFSVFAPGMGPNWLASTSDLLFEVAWNRALSVTRNAAAIDPLTARDAWQWQVVYEPHYNQVLPGLDLSVPFSLSYMPKGKSRVLPQFNTDRSGNTTIGINTTYLGETHLDVAYTHYYGPAGLVSQYSQRYKDRDFISFNVRRTF